MSIVNPAPIEKSSKTFSGTSQEHLARQMPTPYVRRLAYFFALVAVAVCSLTIAEPLRRAEPFIGSRIADMFVFSLLRNDPERLVPTFATAQVPSRVRSNAAGPL